MRISRAIHVISTGGTIDSAYQGAVDTVVPSRKSMMPEYFRSLRLDRRLRFNTVCMKDSRNLVTEDRERLATICSESPFRKLLVTHGTYTMAETAAFLVERLVNVDKVVILTGSLMPLKGFAPSDAPFNLGYSIGRLDDLPAGVYIGFHGVTYRPARFEEFGVLVSTTLRSRFTE